MGFAALYPSYEFNDEDGPGVRVIASAEERQRQPCNLTVPLPPEHRPLEGVIFAAGIMFAAIERKNPGAGAFRGVFSLVQSDGCENNTAWCGGE
jgi:hypothetical protein